MSSKTFVWRNICGLADKYNDIIYRRPIQPPSQDILVFFGGDVQDIEENMQKHGDSKKYLEWSLQNTAKILSTNFPKKHVLVVRPSRMQITRYAVFSCFDNFVPGSEYGVPFFGPMHNALKHLQKLIESVLKQLQTCNGNQDIDQCELEKVKLTLIGFSKGCVVLNQLLHEFHYYHCNPEVGVEVKKFIQLIQSMWWLDGGHAGSKNTWITDKSVLKSFAELRIHTYVHVTPYQVEDILRPWIRSEEQAFCDTLRSMDVPTEEIMHFGDKPRSLKFHFGILKLIKDCTE